MRTDALIPTMRSAPAGEVGAQRKTLNYRIQKTISIGAAVNGVMRELGIVRCLAHDLPKSGLLVSAERGTP